MIRIVFICHGNICRSPMAEFMFKDLVNKNGLASEFIIDSKATSDEEIYLGIGNPIYPNAKEILRIHNIPFTSHNATRLVASDYDKYDYFICMDRNNLRNTLYILNGDKSNKVSLLLDNKDVSDPWYSRDFETCYQDINKGINDFFNKLKDKID